MSARALAHWERRNSDSIGSEKLAFVLIGRRQNGICIINEGNMPKKIKYLYLQRNIFVRSDNKRRRNGKMRSGRRACINVLYYIIAYVHAERPESERTEYADVEEDCRHDITKWITISQNLTVQQLENGPQEILLEKIAKKKTKKTILFFLCVLANFQSNFMRMTRHSFSFSCPIYCCSLETL